MIVHPPKYRHNKGVNVATNSTRVGVRELKNNLSRFLSRVRDGEEVIVYVDTSVLLKLLVVEPGSQAADEIWQSADALTAARVEYAEARAALAAVARSGRITARQLKVAKAELETLWTRISVVEITDELVRAAGQLAEREALRGYDALHLAAAVASVADVLATADTQLLDAASRCGLHTANPG